MKMEYLIATGRTETAVVTERDKFKFPTVRAGIHCAAQGRICTEEHFIDVFDLGISGMKSIFNFFIMVCKDSL